MTGANKGNDVHHALKGPHTPKFGDHEAVAQRLEDLVLRTEKEPHAHVFASSVGGVFSSNASSKGYIGKMSAYVKTLGCLPSSETMDDELANWKMGNYVALRGKDERIFEEMPLYVRVGMHLLFYRSKKASLLRWSSVEHLLKSMSEREGLIYDDASDKKAVSEYIHSFISTYNIDLTQLEEQDLTKYPTRNSFFYRKLRADARPISEPENAAVVSSAADCRLMLFDTVDSAKKIWIKGHLFSIRELLDAKRAVDGSQPTQDGEGGTLPESSTLAIFRLAPADYHRYNHPVGPAKVLSRKHAGKAYYTVNPDAVNEDFDVFTGNTRDITMLEWAGTRSGRAVPVAFVSIGALLVGSNRFTGGDIGASYKRGDEMGYFAYGGSTCIAVFPPEAKMRWDADIAANSQKGIETLVQCNERIGVSEA